MHASCPVCSVLSDSAAPWNVARQAPLSVGFSKKEHWSGLPSPAPMTVNSVQSMAFCRQEYWSGLPFPTSGDLPNTGIEPASPALAGRFLTTSATLEAPHMPPKRVEHM